MPGDENALRERRENRGGKDISAGVLAETSKVKVRLSLSVSVVSEVAALLSPLTQWGVHIK